MRLALEKLKTSLRGSSAPCVGGRRQMIVPRAGEWGWLLRENV